MPPAEHRKGVLAVAAAAVLLSTGSAFIKASDADALSITMWRSAFAVPVIAVFARALPVAPWRAGRATLAAAASYAAMLLFFVAAARLTTAANAVFLQFTAPLYVAALAPRLLGERPSRLDLATLAVALGGMALFFVGRLGGANLAGSIFGAAAGIAFAGLLLALRAPSMTQASRLQAVLLGNAGLAVTLAAASLFRAPADAFGPGPADLARFAYLGAIQVGLAYVVYSYGITRVPALEASLVNMVEPVLNPAWVFLALGERPGWWAALGGAIILAAVATRAVVVERNARRAAIPALGVAAGP